MSFNQGEILYVIDNKSSGWWLAGRMGCIPSSLVSEFGTNQLQKANDEKVEKKLEVVKACNVNYPVVITTSNYSPRRSSELGFKEGDLLLVVNCNDCDWWLVGQVGYIPRNFVSLVSNFNQIPSNKSISPFIAKYDYPSRTNDDLNFKKGDLLDIMVNDDDGWWLAKSRVSGQTGYIPSSYVKEYKSPLDAEE